jgi:hypothetical protein
LPWLRRPQHCPLPRRLPRRISIATTAPWHIVAPTASVRCVTASTLATLTATLTMALAWHPWPQLLRAHAQLPRRRHK